MSIPEPPTVAHLIQAHGTLGALTWAILFPLGAITLRLVNSPKAWLIHAAIMSSSLLVFSANVGIGLWVVIDHWGYQIGGLHRNLGIGNAHTILGLSIFSLAGLQPFLGLSHHFLRKRSGGSRRTFIGAVHVYVGRLLILLGIVNGGIGLLWAENSTSAENIAYGVVCGVVWVVYILMSLGYEVRRENGRLEQADGVGENSRLGDGSSASPVKGDMNIKALL